MSMIEEEITDFILKNSIEIEEVNHDTCLIIRKAINELYADANKKGLWLWEKLRYFDSIIDKDGWSYSQNGVVWRCFICKNTQNK